VIRARSDNRDDRMTYTGIFLAESLRTDAVLDGVAFTVTKVYRLAAGDTAAGQPEMWTFVEFEVAAGDAECFAGHLSEVLNPDGGWYCDFRSDEEVFVVFAGRIFRYPRADRAEREKVEAYGRSVGVPEAQLDWPE
jgi:hypothetical protein